MFRKKSSNVETCAYGCVRPNEDRLLCETKVTTKDVIALFKHQRNRILDKFMKKKGITRRLTVLYTPEQNGVSERKNKTVDVLTKGLRRTKHTPCVKMLGLQQ